MTVSTRPTTSPITVISAAGITDPLEVRSGPLMAPIVRLRTFSAREWEELINEWASTRSGYGLVERVGGAGDMGCDVIAALLKGDPTSQWDNYQCKHYDHPLHPSDIWIELGKLCHYTRIGAYSIPRRYIFVAPQGVGTSLAKLLKHPGKLKQGLLDSWGKNCTRGITSTATVPLDAAMKAHIAAIDFSRFGYLPPQQLINDHSQTPYFAFRFGGGLPPKPPPLRPPDDPTEIENRYVQQLLEAYADRKKRQVSDVASIEPEFRRHFARAREAFYCAETLRNFSRDNLPVGVFEHLMKQISDGVIDTCEAEHGCGFTRLKATTDQASSLSLSSSPLLGRTDIIDRHGICHQLANTDELTWVPKQP